LEIKTTTQNWKNLPAHVNAQVQQQLYVLECEKADVFALTQNHPRIWRVERDDKFITQMVAEEVKFWESVENRVRPTEDVEIEKAREELPSELIPIVAELTEVREQIKALEITKDSLTEVLKNWAILESVQELVVNGAKVASLSSFPTTRFDTKAFQAAYPELATQFAKTTETQRFTFSGF
jgi:predicted phage-related endonuclease